MAISRRAWQPHRLSPNLYSLTNLVVWREKFVIPLIYFWSKAIHGLPVCYTLKIYSRLKCRCKSKMYIMNWNATSYCLALVLEDHLTWPWQKPFDWRHYSLHWKPYCSTALGSSISTYDYRPTPPKNVRQVVFFKEQIRMTIINRREGGENTLRSIARHCCNQSHCI